MREHSPEALVPDRCHFRLSWSTDRPQVRPYGYGQYPGGTPAESRIDQRLLSAVVLQGSMGDIQQVREQVRAAVSRSIVEA